MGYLLPCTVYSKSNHLPVYMQWIGIFGMATQPRRDISMGPRQPEVPGETTICSTSYGLYPPSPSPLPPLPLHPLHTWPWQSDPLVQVMGDAIQHCKVQGYEDYRGKNIQAVANKANQMLDFSLQNLRASPKYCKSMAYISLVRSCMEYAFTIRESYHWSPQEGAMESSLMQCCGKYKILVCPVDHPWLMVGWSVAVLGGPSINNLLRLYIN